SSNRGAKSRNFVGRRSGNSTTLAGATLRSLSTAGRRRALFGSWHLKSNNRAKYLAQYAEPEARLTAPPRDRYSVAVVVPARGEAMSFIDGWKQALDCARAPAPSQHPRPLLIVVVNSSASTPPELVQANRQLLSKLLASGARSQLGPCPAWIVSRGGHDVLAIDRSSPG